MKYFLIGRPNVGKTSIFNKLTISKNIIHREEGTTRDWHKSKIAGLKGIVVKNKQHVFLDKNKCIKFANKNKMFISVK